MPAQSARRADQAAGLRCLLEARSAAMLVVSGVDPGCYAPLALELALASEREGRRVLLIDLTRGALARSLGDASQERRLRYELMHVIDRDKRLDEVVVSGPGELPLLPAARGVRALARALGGRARFADYIERAGASPQLAIAVAPSEELDHLAQLTEYCALMVVGAEGGARLQACYAALKRMHASAQAAYLVYDGALEAAVARSAHSRLIETARRFLGSEPTLVGRLVGVGGGGSASSAGSARTTPSALSVRGARAGFPSLDLAELSRRVAGWPLPKLAALATPRHRSAEGAMPCI